MAINTTCTACQDGEHRHHERVVRPAPEGGVGGAVCTCKGGCNETGVITPTESERLLHDLTSPAGGGYVFPTWESALQEAAKGIEGAYERRRRTFATAHEAGLSYATIGAAVGLSAAAIHKIVRGGKPVPSQEELLKGPATKEATRDA